MRTFEEQRREFIELALKLIEKGTGEYWLHVDGADFCVTFGNYNEQYERITISYIELYFIENNLRLNETEIQKLRDLVEELG